MVFVHRELDDLVKSDPHVRGERPSRRSDTCDNSQPDHFSYGGLLRGSENVGRAEAKAFIEELWVRISDNLIDTEPPGQQAEKQRRKLRILEAIYLELDQ